MTGISPQAITAATEALNGWHWRDHKGDQPHDLVRVILEAAALHIKAAERERLFVAIRRSIPLDKPWRGEVLDLIYAIWQEAQP